MRIIVYYPSGNIVHLSGEWKGPGNFNNVEVILILIDKDCLMPAGSKISDGSPPIVKAGSAFLGDIRGVYQDEDSNRILYNPRECIEGMEKWAVDWLNKHPEWPGILELT